jgi:hypothetical protein
VSKVGQWDSKVQVIIAMKECLEHIQRQETKKDQNQKPNRGEPKWVNPRA